jgi:putative salt-induced outer membrane protein YdiY
MTKMKMMWMLNLALLLAVPGLAGAGEDDEGTADEAPADEAPADEAPADESGDEAGEATTEGAEQATEAVEAATEAVEEATEGATEAVEEATEGATEAVEEATEAVEEPAEVVEATEAPEEAPAAAEKKPDIDLSAEAGAIWLHGNTKSINANGAVHFGVTHTGNKFSLDFGGSYGRGVVADSGSDEWVEIAKKVGGALRYDRFLIPDVNSIYVGGGANHDPLAGFLVQARGDVGYSHQLVNTPKHALAVEAGFNYTRDQYLEPPQGIGGGQNFIGARIAGAYALNVNDNFGFTQGVEALLGGRENQDAGETGFDGRIVSDTALSGSLATFLSVRFGFKLTYDFVPPVKADGTSFEALDTTTSITLVATFM